MNRPRKRLSDRALARQERDRLGQAWGNPLAPITRAPFFVDSRGSLLPPSPLSLDPNRPVSAFETSLLRQEETLLYQPHHLSLEFPPRELPDLA